MSADVATMLVATVTVGVSLAGLTLALWRGVRTDIRAMEVGLRADIRAVEASLRAEDAELRADIRAVRAAIDADRLAHEALHAAERQTRADEWRELLAAVSASREDAP